MSLIQLEIERSFCKFSFMPINLESLLCKLVTFREGLQK